MYLPRIFYAAVLCSLACWSLDSGQAKAQLVIGGPNGVVIGGGRGIRIGGRDGVNIVRGQGARFGPPSAGVQIGGGYGARFGTPYEGLQIGGGQGFRAGTPSEGMQFGTGQGVQMGTFNQYSGPVTAVQPAGYPPQYTGQPTAPGPNSVAPANAPSINAPTPAAGSAMAVAPQPAPDVDRQPKLEAPRTTTPRSNLQQSVEPPVPPQVPEMIVLKYPKDAGRSLRYTVNGTAFQLSPGNSVRMKSGQDWRVGIPGGQGKVQVFSLREAGNYTVNRTESGWSIDSEKGDPVAKIETPQPVPPQPETLQPETLQPETLQPRPPQVEPPTPVPPQVEAPRPKAAPQSAPKKKDSGNEQKSVLEFNKSGGK